MATPRKKTPTTETIHALFLVAQDLFRWAGIGLYRAAVTVAALVGLVALAMTTLVVAVWQSQSEEDRRIPADVYCWCVRRVGHVWEQTQGLAAEARWNLRYSTAPEQRCERLAWREAVRIMGQAA